MNKVYLYTLLFTVIISTFFVNEIFANNNSSQSKNISINRFDKDLLDYLNSPTTEKGNNLINKHPILLPALAQTITSTSNQDNALENIYKYFSHPILKSIYVDVVNKFNDISEYEDDLTQMSKIAVQQLHIKSPPQFSVHISGFKENTIYVSNIISLSIDKYMGKEYSGYKGYFKPNQLQQMNPVMIVRDFTKAWLMADYIKTESTSGDLLSEMIEQGKLLYTLSVLLPQYNEYNLAGYSTQEYDWMLNNEQKIWNTIVKRNHLYTTDLHIISMYFDDQPLSNTIIKDAPQQIGSWIGYKIVKKYANESKKPLIDIINAETRLILKESKYKP